MDLRIVCVCVVFALGLLWPVNIYASRRNNQSDITRLTDKCMRFRDQDLDNTDITIDDVATFCASQAIKTIHSRIEKSDHSEDAILYILELYRKMIQRKSGSNSLHSLKRQEVRTLKRSDWNTFVTRLNMLKTNMITRNTSRYDVLTDLYTSLAIGSPSYLIQHRVFLRLVEEALETSIPYWDIRIDQNMTNPRISLLWRPEYFGNGFGSVVTGPFANWASRDGSPLSRDIGSIGWLFSQKDFDQIMSLGSHHDILEPNRFPQKSLEFLSTGTKLWVKGWSSSTSGESLDPVFIMIDAFIDFVWDIFWEKLQLTDIDPVKDYHTLNNLNLDVFERDVLSSQRAMYDHSIPCESCGRHLKTCVGEKCQTIDNLSQLQLVDGIKTVQTIEAVSQKADNADETKFLDNTHNLRVKRHTNNALGWGTNVDSFNWLRASRLVRNTSLTGPQRARAAIAVIGPLPIGRRFTSPFIDPRTRGDPLPIGPLRRRLRRGFYPMTKHGGFGRVIDYNRIYAPPKSDPKFTSILTDVRTMGDPTLTKTHKPQRNQILPTGINRYQLKTNNKKGWFLKQSPNRTVKLY